MTNLTVRAFTLTGTLLHMYCVVKRDGNNVATGHTDIVYNNAPSGSYNAVVQDYGSYVFDHWGSNVTNTNRSRTENLGSAAKAIWDAKYRGGSTPPPPTPSPVLTINTVYPNPPGGPARFWVQVTGGPVPLAANAPFTFTGVNGTTYIVSPTTSYGDYTFDRWENGSTVRQRSLTLTGPITITATYKYISGPPPPPPSDDKSQWRGVYVPLYGGGTGTAQQTADVANDEQFENVPFIVAINPDGGPGGQSEKYVRDIINILKTAPNITIIGYIPTGYAYSHNTPRNSNGDINLAFNFTEGVGEVRIVDTDGSERNRVQVIINAGKAWTRTSGNTLIHGVGPIVNVIDEVNKYRLWYPDVKGFVADEVYNYPYGDTNQDPAALIKQQYYRRLIAYSRQPATVNGTAVQGMTYFKANLGGNPRSDGVPTLTEDAYWTSADIAEGRDVLVQVWPQTWPQTPLVNYLKSGSVNGQYWKKCSCTRYATPASALNQTLVSSWFQYVKDYYVTSVTGGNVYGTIPLLAQIVGYADTYNRSKGYY